MVQILAMENIELHEYATKYNIDVTPVESDNNFTSYSGQKVSGITGHQTVINVTLIGVPHGTAEKIAEIVNTPEFELTYTTPIQLTNKFRCTKYAPEIKSADPREKNPLVTNKITWNISLTLESTDISNSGGGL